MKKKHTSEILRQKRKHLITEFLNRKEPDFLNRCSRSLDEYFQKTYENSITGSEITAGKNPYAIVALGGYGREEQCIHSDVDILFLFKDRVPDSAEALVREFVYPLWDMGFHVGQATRSVEECVEMADINTEVLTSVLDARFICGASLLYSDMIKYLREKIILPRSDELIANLIEINETRHQYFGDSTYLLEPNLKEGQGGLRDYHTILWIARITTDIKQPRDLEYYGCLSHDEFHELTESLDFIWHVRNHLHHLIGKKYDQLHFEHQEILADLLNFNQKNGQYPVERFLGELHGKMNFLKQQHLMFIYERTKTLNKKKGRKLGKNSAKQSRIKDIEVSGRYGLKFVSPESILNTPYLLIKIFEESALLDIPLSVEARRLIKNFLYLVDDKFRTSEIAVKSFEKILATPTFEFSVLNEMLDTGFLETFIPEFGEIVNRIQYDEYHLYPVDKHSLRTVQTIKKFGTADDPTEDDLCGNLYEEIINKNILLWSALLHDIGKGKPGGGHAEKGVKIADSIMKAKGYAPEHVETVCFLIQEHLLLAKTATRRDIQDEETAIFCARKIKDPERLKMLYLLTVADSISTGPKAWGKWVSTLLKELFLNVLSTLENKELATHEAVETVEKKKTEILHSASGKDEKEYLESLFNVMSPRYLLYTSTPDILEHVRLCKTLGNADFVWEITKMPNLNTRTITICAKDSPGLFSKFAGVFALNNIDILDAQVYTWRNHIALDVFKVKPPPDLIFEGEKWERAKENLESALSGDLDLGDSLTRKLDAYGYLKPHAMGRPNQIIVDNNTSSFFTIIEVFTYDAPGLLFKITDALFRCKLDVWLAKIATNVDQAVDVFYVRDFDGQKADSPDQVALIKETVEKVFPK